MQLLVVLISLLNLTTVVVLLFRTNCAPPSVAEKTLKMFCETPVPQENTPKLSCEAY
jgi:hypothetical protein